MNVANVAGIAHVDVAEIGELLGRAALLDVQRPWRRPSRRCRARVLAVVGRAVDHRDDVEVLVRADLAHLVDVGHHERLEVGVGHRVVQHRPAVGRGRLAARTVVRRRSCRHHRTRCAGARGQRRGGDDGRRESAGAVHRVPTTVHRSLPRHRPPFVRRSIEPVNGGPNRSRPCLTAGPRPRWTISTPDVRRSPRCPDDVRPT